MKKLFTTLGIVGMFILGIKTVSAANYSYVENGPEVYSGAATRSNVTVLSSAAYNSVTGNRVHFYVTTFGNLRSNVCVSNSSRTATIKIWEDDVDPNADDLVQTLVYGFSGLKLSSIKSKVVHDTGNIDSAGDPTVELYNTVYVSPINGDSGATNGILYKYQYSID